MLKLSGAVLFIGALCACSVNNIREDDSLSKYFEHLHEKGTFAMFDNGTGEFTIYDVGRYRDSVYLPASTFNIVTAMIGIETGLVKDSNAVISEGDSSVKMHDAFQASDNSWFGELAKRIGKDTMQRWLDTLGYGRRYNKPLVKDNLETFWLDNSMKVTADEQLGLVKKLYFGQLPFQPRSQRIVKNMMKREDNSNYKLSYITGSGSANNGHPIGWIIGFIEENRHPYFFVFQTESAVTGSWKIDLERVDTLKEILRQYGFMEGKR